MDDQSREFMLSAIRNMLQIEPLERPSAIEIYNQFQTPYTLVSFERGTSLPSLNHDFTKSYQYYHIKILPHSSSWTIALQQIPE